MSSNSAATSCNNAEALWQSVADRASLGQSMGEQQPACAACKHQRKRCDTKNCVFLPYFPGDKKEEFNAVRQVFGVVKVKKMLQSCKAGDERQCRADEIKWLASMLLKTPAEGPLAHLRRLSLDSQKKNIFINQLQNHIQMLNCYQTSSVAFCSNCTRISGSSRDDHGSINRKNMADTVNNSQVSHFGNQIPSRDCAFTINAAPPQLFHASPNHDVKPTPLPWEEQPGR